VVPHRGVRHARNDPWCVTEPLLNLLNAYVSTTESSYEDIGSVYMLTGDTEVSNRAP